MAKKRRLVWSDRAKAELRDIKNFIAQQAPRTAQAFVRQIRARCRNLLTMPFAAPMVEEVGSHTFRETYHGSYRIMFQITSDAVVIVSIFHGARLFLPDKIEDAGE